MTHVIWQLQFSFAISSNSYEIYDYCWMSVQKSMIFNFMIPTSILIISNTIFGTMTLRSVVSKQRQVIVESIENILDKCQNIEAVNSVNLLAPDTNLTTDYIPTVKCCDEMDKVSVLKLLWNLYYVYNSVLCTLWIWLNEAINIKMNFQN